MKKISVKVVKTIVSKLWELARDLIFPPRCVICDKVILVEDIEKISRTDTTGANARSSASTSTTGANARSSASTSTICICPTCRKQIDFIHEPVCKKCGKMLPTDRIDTPQEYCFDCRKHNRAFIQSKAIFQYKGEVKTSMYRFKYSNRRCYKRTYGALAARMYGDWIRRNHIQYITGMPMYAAKERKRGYNQAQEFADAIGQEMGIPSIPNLVVRTRNTKPQKGLNDHGREKNLDGAFAPGKYRLNGAIVLLVDDIYTTGSSCHETSKALYQAGASKVYCMTICVGAAIFD